MKKELKHRIEPQVKGHNVTQGLTTLAAIEARLGSLCPNGKSEARFRIVGNWLVRDETLWDRLWRSPSRASRGSMITIPNFPIRSRVFTLRDLLFASRVRARTSANAVCFRSNMRAFYLDRQPLTLWIGTKKESFGKLSIAMQLRSRLTSSTKLRTPRVIAHDKNSEPPYILEELITGRPFSLSEDWVMLVDKVLPTLFRFYDQENIHHHPAAEVYNFERIYQGVANSIYNFREKKKWMIPLEVLLKGLDQCLRLTHETLPVCTGHGDLNKNNLVIDIDGRIVLLDWEWSRKLPIAEEVMKLVPVLLNRYPQLINRLALELRQRTEDPVAMPPKRQVLLATFYKIATNADRSKKVNRWLKVASNLITGPDW